MGRLEIADQISSSIFDLGKVGIVIGEGDECRVGVEGLLQEETVNPHPTPIYTARLALAAADHANLKSYGMLAEH